MARGCIFTSASISRTYNNSRPQELGPEMSVDQRAELFEVSCLFVSEPARPFEAVLPRYA